MADRLKLPDLPYKANALEPHISARTLEFHHGKHHASYVQKANDALKGTELEGKPLEEIVAAAKNSGNQGLFNNAAQSWNHSFFWNSMSPSGGGEPSGTIGKRIAEDFGSYEKFREKFESVAAGQFGSGWAWLVVEGDKLNVISTANADTPIAHGKTPLVTLDVWEHAYYLDYQNRRPDFIKAWLDELVNWEYAEKNLAGMMADAVS